MKASNPISGQLGRGEGCQPGEESPRRGHPRKKLTLGSLVFETPVCPAAVTGGSYESMDLSGFLCLIPNLSGLVKFDGA